MRRETLGIFAAGALAGCAAGLLFDPRSGTRRRAVVRDKLGKYGRQTARTVRGRVRASAGPIQGAMHEVARHAPGYAPESPPDMDMYIKQRVESALGHESHLPLHAVNFDAAGGVVRVRGTVPDAICAEEIVARTAEVDGVRAVLSLMHTPDGTPVGGSAGDLTLIAGEPLGVVHTREVRDQLLARWPALDDALILASEGHIGRLVELIGERTGAPEAEVRAELDQILVRTP